MGGIFQKPLTDEAFRNPEPIKINLVRSKSFMRKKPGFHLPDKRCLGQASGDWASKFPWRVALSETGFLCPQDLVSDYFIRILRIENSGISTQPKVFDLCG